MTGHVRTDVQGDWIWSEPTVIHVVDGRVTVGSVELALAADPGKSVVIVAPSRPAYDEYRKAIGITVRRAVYATPASARGRSSDTPVIVLPGWHRRRDAATLMDSLRLMWISCECRP